MTSLAPSSQLLLGSSCNAPPTNVVGRSIELQDDANNSCEGDLTVSCYSLVTNII